MKATRLRLFYFALFVTYGAFLPFFPTWLEARGVRGLAMSAIMALGPATGIVGPPAFGALSDWLGLRAGLLRLATAGCLVAMLLLAVPGMLGHVPTFPLLFVAMLLFSICRAPAVAITDVITIEAVKAATTTEKAQSYGGIRMWGSVGFLIAAVAAGRAIDVREVTPLPLILAATSLVTVVLAFLLTGPAPPRAAHLGVSLRGVLRARGFRLLLLSGFLGFGAHVCYDICFSLHLLQLGLSSGGVGLAWAIAVLGEVALMAVSGPILARFPASSLLVAAYSTGAVRWLLVALIPNVTVLLLLQPLHAISFALFWVTALDQVKQRAPREIQGTAQGLFNASIGAGAAFGMLAWGAIFERHGGPFAFGCAAVVAAGAAFTASRIDRGGAPASGAGVRAASRDLV